MQLCQRWCHADAEPGTEQHTDSPNEQEAGKALQAWRKRSLSWRSLPGNFTTRTPSQRRADALLLMSARALAHAGPAVSSSDRYRVLVTIDSRMLGADAETHGAVPGAVLGEQPPERPAIQGFGPIAVATAQRLASQARLTVVATDAEGEVVATGRDTRLFSATTFRALIARDRCCQMPGCAQSRTGWLHAHHVIPWAQGSQSTLSNAALLCLTMEEQTIARAKIAAVQRFRLLRGDGSWVAGPRRCDQQSDLAGEEFSHGNSGKDVLPDRGNVNSAHWGNTLEQYRA